jgi:endonuclease III
MAAMEVANIQAIIAPIGLAPTKAKNLSNMSKVGSSVRSELPSLQGRCDAAILQ